MTWEPRPVPNVTPESKPFWRGAASGRLLVQECRSCRLTFFYPRAQCPECFDTTIEWVEADGLGAVYTYSTSERVKEWPKAELPLVLAYVELDEGPRVLTNLVDCDPEEVDVGTRVEVRFVPTELDDVAVPVFTPTGD